MNDEKLNQTEREIAAKVTHQLLGIIGSYVQSGHLTSVMAVSVAGNVLCHATAIADLKLDQILDSLRQCFSHAEQMVIEEKERIQKVEEAKKPSIVLTDG